MAHRLCQLDEIADGQARGFRLELPGGPLRIFAARRGDAVFAYRNRCPHRGTPLDWVADQFFDRSGEHLVCATHGAVFRLDDGHCLAGPCLGETLTPVPLTLREGVLYADVAA